MISVFATAVLGIVIGVAGKAIMPGKDTGGAIATGVLGICCANLGNSMGWLMDWWPVGSLAGFGAAAATTVLGLIIYRGFAAQTGE
ncbi:MAG: GlsB/YeaQ/YmgE family stress response membrane protein [Bryobacterales bacterium]|nr:GlsB/YeaQ/YmgE family stress response membrane protein [Bryobacterales bacterium]